MFGNKAQPFSTLPLTMMGFVDNHYTHKLIHKYCSQDLNDLVVPVSHDDRMQQVEVGVEILACKCKPREAFFYTNPSC